MRDNIRDVFRIITEYSGTGFFTFLYAASLIFLLIKEKDKKTRLIVCALPLLLLLIYLCPLYYRLFVLHLDSHGTYYRNLWMIPELITVCYSAIKLLDDSFLKEKIKLPEGLLRGILGFLLSLVIILCGSFSFAKNNTVRAENPYHIPDYVIELADEMEQDIPGVSVYACVPLEMLFYIRQYNSDICLIYGREAAEPVWGYDIELYNAFELSEVLDLSEVLSRTRSKELGVGVASYFVIPADRKINGDIEALGLEKKAEAGGYCLYVDKAAVQMVREILAGTPYLE